MENLAVPCERVADLCDVGVAEVAWALGTLNIPLLGIETGALVRLSDVLKPEVIDALDAAIKAGAL